MHFVSKEFASYVVSSDAGLREIIQRIADLKGQTVFVTADNGSVIGSISDGDIRRTLIRENLEVSGLCASDVMNKNVRTVRDKTNVSSDVFCSEGRNVNTIPIVDELDRIVGLISKDRIGIRIGEFYIDDTAPVFVIAEIGNNHNGSFSACLKLVDAAVEAGASCVKFQLRDLDQLYLGADIDGVANDLGVEYTLDLLKKYSPSNEFLLRVFDYCRERGILALCTPWDLSSVQVLEKFGVPAYKVASADLTNELLLERLAETGKPLICSTGMATEAEILAAADFLRRRMVPVIFLHCNSTYPTPAKDVNLRYMQRLGAITNSYVGYSGHELGFYAPIMAVALGARVVEKHLTLDKSQEGPDHKVSLTPTEFREMVREIRSATEALGTPAGDLPRTLSQGEMLNRHNLGKSLIAASQIKQGETITREKLTFASPGDGIAPNRISEIVGSIANRTILKGEQLTDNDLGSFYQKPERFNFKRPVGIPARFHDLEDLVSDIQLDFVEFHLSYRDLGVNLANSTIPRYDLDFCVHCPELFEGDHLLCLASESEDYRRHSVEQLNRVIDFTNELKVFFPKTLKPTVVVNVGGWSRNDFIGDQERVTLRANLIESIKQIDLSGIQLAIQTMPPFPWHFGGKSHHNLFVEPNDIESIISSLPGVKVCLDISHSAMACSYYGISFSDFLKRILPLTCHLHISDAKGVDGEGISIGKGDVDFFELAKLLNAFAPKVPFVPEIWQGHKNNGRGFWEALIFLERYEI